MTNLTRQESIVHAVLQYLAAHPAAGDTASGVARSWLPAGLRVDQRDVAAALELLVREGRIDCVRLPDRDPLYKRRAAG